MATDLTLMTTQQADGTGLAAAHSGGHATFNAALTALNAQRSGVAVIALGVAAVTLLAAVIDPSGATYAGKPAFAVMGEVDGTLTTILSCVWVANDLVITGNANATAESTIFWFVDGRA